MHTLIRDFLLGVQRDLETQNGLPALPTVDRFIISTEEKRALSDADTNEQVFVGEAHMGVFIAEPVLDRVATHGLSMQTLDDYCVAAEGISHYLYLMARAEQARPVTLLELELQAEVDKFVHVADKLALDTPGQHTLIDQLFERYSLHEHLSAEERERYTEASRRAARVCYKLVSRTRNRAVAVRKFFALSLEDKLRF